MSDIWENEEVQDKLSRMKPEMQIVFLRAMRRVYAKESSSVLTQIGHSKNTVKMMNDDYVELREKQAMLKGVLEERRKPNLQDVLEDNTKANAVSAGDEVQVLVLEDETEENKEEEKKAENEAPKIKQKIRKVLWVKTKTVPVDSQVISSMSALITAAKAFKKKKDKKKEESAPLASSTNANAFSNAAVAPDQTNKTLTGTTASSSESALKTTNSMPPAAPQVSTANASKTQTTTHSSSGNNVTVNSGVVLGAGVTGTDIKSTGPTEKNNSKETSVTETAGGEKVTRNGIDVTSPSDVTMTATSLTGSSSEVQGGPENMEDRNSEGGYNTGGNTAHDTGEPKINPYQPLPGIGGRNPYPDDTNPSLEGATDVPLTGEAGSEEKKKKVVKKKKKVPGADDNGEDGEGGEGADKKKKKKKKKLVAAAKTLIAVGVTSAETVPPVEEVESNDVPILEAQEDSNKTGESFLPTIGGTPKPANKNRPQSSVVPLPQIEATATEAGDDGAKKKKKKKKKVKADGSEDVTVAEITVISAEETSAPVLAVSHDAMGNMGAQQMV